MVIGFNKQFPDKITAGTKKHTIREDVHNRWRAGMTMHMATGVRTKSYKCFKQDTCKGTQTIEIVHDNQKKIASVYIDGKHIGHWSKIFLSTHYSNLRQLAKNDGFETTDAFFEWFNKDFTGKLIHWTDLRY